VARIQDLFRHWTSQKKFALVPHATAMKRNPAALAYSKDSHSFKKQ